MGKIGAADRDLIYKDQKQFRKDSVLDYESNCKGLSLKIGQPELWRGKSRVLD